MPGSLGDSHLCCLLPPSHEERTRPLSSFSLAASARCQFLRRRFRACSAASPCRRGMTARVAARRTSSSATAIRHTALPMFLGLSTTRISAAFTWLGMQNVIILKKMARFVAFEGEYTGRRFLGCARSGGGICSTVNWIDPEWPPAMKKCLVRLWELYDEECSVRIGGAVEQAEEYYKLNQVKKELEVKVKELQIDLGKALMAHQVPNQMQNQLELQIDEKKKAELQINQLLAENKRLQEMKEKAEKNRDVLKADKKKLEYYIADLLKVAHVNKDKFKKIKEIIDE